MTIANTASRWDYNGDGASTVFPYGSRIFAAGDLKVYVDGTLKTLTTHYAVSGVDADGGGNVTFTAPPAVGTRNVVIVRDVPLTQATSYPANDPFPARSHERALDRLTIIAQQLFGRVSRAMRLSDTSAYDGSLILPDAVAGKAIGWNATADGLTNDPADFTATIAAVAEQAGIATAQAGVATAQAGTATAQAAAATTQAGNATTQAGIAATQATASAASATAAAASATNAAASAAAADVAKVEWQGAWSGATAYAVHDAVQSAGTSYVCIQAHTNHQPPNAAYWDLLAAKGTDGTGIGDMLAANNLSEVTPATARTNLGLGTAATLDVGATAGKVVQLDGSARLPPVDGSLLTGLSAADDTARDQIAALFLGAVITSAVVTGAMVNGTADAFATDTIGGTSTNETYDSGGDYYHNPVPTPGDLLTGGTVSASAESLSASNAIDDNTGTSWETVANSSDEWWKYDLGLGNDAAASALRLYSLDARLNAFMLSGSNDNSSWTVVITDIYSVDNTWASYTISDATSYRYWKLDITGIPGNDVIVKEIELLARTSAPDMTLVSAAATATAAPTDARLCVLYKDDSGTAAINTDVIFESTRDGGATWTTVTMVDAGDYDGTYRKLIGHADISAQPSGTSMKWRITTLNNKAQRVRGVAQMWGG